jgi:hypothetical protein
MFERDRCQVTIWSTLQSASCVRTRGGGGGNGDLCIVSNNEGGGQVLSLIHCTAYNAAPFPAAGNRCTKPPSCCFIGYASSRVAAIVVITLEGNEYVFAISRTHHAHESKVTDLTFVNCGMSPRNRGAPVLFLACCAGKIYFYPHTYNPDKNFSTERLVLAF